MVRAIPLQHGPGNTSTAWSGQYLHNMVTTNIGEYSKTCYKKLVTRVESHASAVSLPESGEKRYMKAIIIIIIMVMTTTWSR